MEKWFFLDRVQMNDGGIPVHKAVVFSSPVLTHSTKPPFPFRNTAAPGAQFTLDLSSVKGCEIGGELYLNEAFLGHFRPQGFRKPEEASKAKGAETRRADLQEFPFCQVGLGNALSMGFSHVICSLVNSSPDTEF